MNAPTRRLSREDCTAAAEFVADLENYVTDLDGGYCELSVSMRHATLRTLTGAALCYDRARNMQTNR